MLKAGTIPAIPIVNRKSRWRPITRAAFPRFAALPKPPLDAAPLQIYLLAPSHEEDVKRLEQDRSNTKSRKAKCSVRAALETLDNRGSGVGDAGRAYAKTVGRRRSRSLGICRARLGPKVLGGLLLPETVIHWHRQSVGSLVGRVPR
jgi:hypothetical protein